jgi:hypothetical protein
MTSFMEMINMPFFKKQEIILLLFELVNKLKSSFFPTSVYDFLLVAKN